MFGGGYVNYALVFTEIPYEECSKFLVESKDEDVDEEVPLSKKQKKRWRRVRVIIPGGRMLRVDRKLAIEMGVWPMNVGSQQVCLWSSVP